MHSPMDHLRPSHGPPNPLPPQPASSSPRALRSCSWSGPCPLRPLLTSSGIWWQNFGVSQSSGHPRLPRSHPRLPHLWPASPLGGYLHPPPLAFLGLSPQLPPAMGSLMPRTGLKGSWQRMEVLCTWWAPRSRSHLAQTHRKSWSDHQAPTGPADPSQEYNLRDLSSSKDERIWQTQPERGCLQP